jgi:hypothetical protein
MARVAQPIAKAAQLPERARVREGDAAGPDRIKVSSAGQVLWVVQSTDAGFATLGELSLGPNAVNVLGRFGGSMRFGSSALTSAGLTDYFLAQLRR